MFWNMLTFWASITKGIRLKVFNGCPESSSSNSDFFEKGTCDLEGDSLTLGTVSLENFSLAELEDTTIKIGEGGTTTYRIDVL